MNTESPQKSVNFVSSLPRYKNNDTDSPPELATSKGVQKKAVNLQQWALIHSEIKRQVDAAPRAAMTGPQIEDERMILVKVVKGIPEFMETVSRKKGKLVRSARRFDNMLRKFQASYGVRFSVQKKTNCLQ